jgi:SlyX protein
MTPSSKHPSLGPLPGPAAALDPYPSDRDETRFEALEIKLSYLEDMVETLNQLVYEQRQLADTLRREVLLLRQQAPDPGAPAFRSLRDDLPPHY